MRYLLAGMLLVISVVVLAQPPAVPIYSPWTAAQTAFQDIQSVPAERRSYVRYLSLYNIEPLQRQNYLGCLSFLINSLSREKILTRPYVVPSSDNTLVRIFLDDYQIDSKKWDQLIQQGSGPAASRTPEPYFYTQLVRDVDVYEERKTVYRQPQRYDPYRRPLAKISDREVVEKVKTGTKKESRQATAPWIATDGGQAIASLVNWTQSSTPIVRADWWVYNASLAPGYYDIAGIGKKVADFEELVFADSKLAAKARAQVRGAVVFSGVSLNNRALERIPTIGTTLGGYYWSSLDVNNSIDEKDFINNLLGRKIDASEIIASLRNGLQVYAVFDGQGNRLDAGATDVVQDSETVLRDHTVRNARNCMFCHHGIRSINDEVRSLSRDKIALLVVDPKQARDIADRYFATDLTQVIEHDNAFFTAAVKATNGLTPAANSALLEKIIQRYFDDPLDVEHMAAELGVTNKQLLTKLRQAVNIDHTLVSLLATPPRPVLRAQFEKSFGQAMFIIETVGP